MPLAEFESVSLEKRGPENEPESSPEPKRKKSENEAASFLPLLMHLLTHPSYSPALTDFLDPIFPITARYVSRSFSSAASKLRNECWVLRQTLNVFKRRLGFVDKESLNRFLTEHDGIVSGSMALSCILNSSWQPSDIDLYVYKPAYKEEDVSSLHAHIPEDIERDVYVDDSYGGSFSIGLVAVTSIDFETSYEKKDPEFLDLCKDSECKKIQVLSTCSSPEDAMAHFDFSILFNHFRPQSANAESGWKNMETTISLRNLFIGFPHHLANLQLRLLPIVEMKLEKARNNQLELPPNSPFPDRVQRQSFMNYQYLQVHEERKEKYLSRGFIIS